MRSLGTRPAGDCSSSDKWLEGRKGDHQNRGNLTVAGLQWRIAVNREQGPHSNQGKLEDWWQQIGRDFHTLQLQSRQCPGALGQLPSTASPLGSGPGQGPDLGGETLGLKMTHWDILPPDPLKLQGSRGLVCAPPQRPPEGSALQADSTLGVGPCLELTFRSLSLLFSLKKTS